jgi:HAD superfamily hydrolase (TIGR01509 family)
LSRKKLFDFSYLDNHINLIFEREEMIKAIIFDLDGLLINSEPLWLKAKIDFMKELNNVWTNEDQENSMGVSTQTWVDYIHRKINGVVSKEHVLKGIVERMKNYYNNGEIELMPGANEALNFASENFKVGLASGSYKELLCGAVKSNKWEKVFDEILSSDDMERGKPNPDIYIEIMKRMDVSPQESVVLEDSRDGIKAGVAAGAKVIAVPSKEVPVPQEVLDSAYAITDTLFAFPKIIKELNK